MEPIVITHAHFCLSFDALSSEDKATVLEKYQDWNIDYDWWDSVYKWFEEYALAEYGVKVDPERISFRGFYSQGDGASFTGHVVDIEKVIASGKPTRRYHRPEQFNRVIRYMFNECGLSLTTHSTGFYDTSQATEIERYKVNPHETYYPGQQDAYVFAEDALEWLESQWVDICNELAYSLYSNLEQAYDYLTSDEALAESFEANECLFEIGTGKMVYR